MLRYFILFLLLQFSFVSWAQKNDFHFTKFSVANGLSNNAVIAMEQDQLGNMWLGTRNGLNKYNGDRFEVFLNNPKDANSLSNSDILSLLEDSEGNIWVGTYNGLNRYNPITNSFTRYYSEDLVNPIVNNVIICMEEMPNDEIWFGTARGISIYSKITKKFINIRVDKNSSTGLPNRNIQRIFIDSSNEIWVATTRGLARYVSRVNNDFVFERYRKPRGSEIKTGFFIQDIIEVRKNVLGIATKYNGFWYFNTIKKRFVQDAHNKLSPTADVRVLEKTPDGNIWMGTTHGVIILTKDREIHNLQSSRKDVASLSSNFVKSIFKDDNGSVWLGMYSGGVNVWNASNENFTNFRNDDLDNNFVTDIVSDEESNLYIGTEGGDITFVSKDLKVLDVFEVSDANETRKYPVQSLHLSEEKQLWVGVLNHGVFLYDTQTHKRIDGVIADRLVAYLKNTSIYSIKESPKNIFWIATFGKGLIRYNHRLKSYRIYGTNLGKEPYLSTDFIKTIHVDGKRNLWLGGLGKLNMLRFKKGYKYDLFTYDVDIEFGGNIKSIFEDSNNTIWVGTNSKGLQKFNGEKFERVFLDSLNPITMVNTILQNSNGDLWLSCERGIVQFNTQKNKAIFYSNTGMRNLYEYTPNSGIVINNSQLVFGGENGITMVDPKKINKNYYSPQVVLSDFKIKNKSVKIGQKDGVLTKHISFTEKVSLSYDKANFSINYAIPSFINSQSNSYKYRLVGLDDTWYTTSKTEVFYTLQTPGKYIFEVKGANNFGVWNKKATRLFITVKPAPWKSWWAFSIYAILIALGLIGIFLVMESKTKLQHKLDMEYLEGERVKELNATKLQFFTNISHEFRTPLTLILGPLQQILEDYSGSNSMYKKLRVIESSSNHLLRLINRLMDFRKLENNQANIQTAEGNIVKYLREIFLSFSEFAKTGNYNYTFETTHDEILVYYDRYKLERVFYNLISNAFRYTPEGGNISLKIKKTSKNIIIRVIDSGVGISEEHIDKIFDRFFEVAIHNKPEKNYNKGTGIGLSIASNIVKLHHGKISVSNNAKGGAMFTVKLLLGKEHLSPDEVSNSFVKSDDVSQYVTQLDVLETGTDQEINDLKESKKELSILLVEDNTSLRTFMKDLLKDEYTIFEAENGRVALDLAQKKKPDLIVSDVVMPEMVGTELCAKIKSDINTSHIPVILLTSRSSLIYKFEGLESGADDYISKPFNLKEFKLRINNILELKSRLKDKFSGEDHFVPSEVAVTSKDEELLARAFKVVEENISNEDFDVAMFVSELGVSRSLLFTKIKAWSNMTPNEFIREIRLKRAAQLLEQNKINVSQVGYKVGFKRPKYFSQCFKKKYGLTPTEYTDKFYKES